jgi:hypothetical protein
MAEASDSYQYHEAGLLDKYAQSHLKPAQALVVKTWKVLVPIFLVPEL